MTDFSDIIFNEQWDKVFKLISNDKTLISEIDSYDIAWKRFYYGLVENGKEEHIPPYGQFSDLLKVVDICISNGMKGKSIPQATAFEDKNTIDKLISEGHRIDEEDFGERTALMVAATLNNIDLVRYIIDRNASISHYDQDNYEAIDFTTSNEIIELLKSLGGKTKDERNKEYDEYCVAREYWNDIREINLAFMKGAENMNFNQMKDAFERSNLKSMTLNFAYPINGWTALHYATKNNDKKTINFLIQQGIAVDKKNIDGMTAKELAYKLGFNELFDN
jgi:hypothetical protein